MRQIADDQRLPADVEAQAPVQAAAALRSVIRAYHDELEREQRLPKALVEQFHAAGFYRLVRPRELGGLQADPLTYLRTVELLAEASGRSTGPAVTSPSPALPCRAVAGRYPSTVATGSPVAGHSAPGARRAPGCWAASRSSMATSRAGVRMAPRSTGAASSIAPRHRSSREAGTCPGSVRPAASTGRSTTSFCR